MVLQRSHQGVCGCSRRAFGGRTLARAACTIITLRVCTVQNNKETLINTGRSRISKSTHSTASPWQLQLPPDECQPVAPLSQLFDVKTV